MIFEAQLIGFKEGLKICLIWLVLYSFLFVNDKKALMKPFYAGLFFSMVIALASLLVPKDIFVKEYLNNAISMSFTLFLVLSAASLFHQSGVNLLGPLSSGRRDNSSLPYGKKGGAVIFLLTPVLFAPDISGSLFFLSELAFMKETIPMTYISAASGFCIAAAIFFAIDRLYRPYRIGTFFDVPQLLLFFAMVKLLGSGIQGIAELSLIPSVQRGFMKFVHDVVHQTFVFLMVPDHMLLKTTVWNFIAFFFGPNFASIASLVILLFFPLMFIHHSLLVSVPEPEARSNAERRSIKARILSEKRKKALPVILFIGLILFGWFSQSGETVSRLFIPKPKPVVADGGSVAIPINDPTMDLMDGMIHKFSLAHEGETIGIMIMKKSDNSLSVCLDACEICPPEGYGQRDDHVVCIYCGTPLHVDSLGQPGGCNPIPLKADIDGRFVRIDMNEILKKWGFVTSGESKGEIR